MSEYKVPVQSLIDHIKTAVDVDPWAKEMAEELLKEQGPVSVMGPDIYEEYWAREAICPDCGTHWMSYDKNGKRVTKYCPGCRRPVKWE